MGMNRNPAGLVGLHRPCIRGDTQDGATWTLLDIPGPALCKFPDPRSGVSTQPRNPSPDSAPLPPSTAQWWDGDPQRRGQGGLNFSVVERLPRLPGAGPSGDLDHTTLEGIAPD